MKIGDEVICPGAQRGVLMDIQVDVRGTLMRVGGHGRKPSWFHERDVRPFDWRKAYRGFVGRYADHDHYAMAPDEWRASLAWVIA